MIILRKQFSTKTREENKRAKKERNVAIGLGVLGLSGNEISDKAFEHLKEKGKDQGDISERLLKDAKKELGTSFIGNSGGYYDFIGNRISGDKNNAAEIAHEIGHAHYSKSKNAGKIGKIAHKAYNKMAGGVGTFIVGPLASGITSGIGSGIVKAQAEKRGEKESKLNKALPYLFPVAVSTPGLISEAAASKHAIELLKKQGLDKKAISAAKKELGSAFGTYAGLTAMGTAIGGLSRYGSYKAYRSIKGTKTEKKGGDGNDSKKK